MNKRNVTTIMTEALERPLSWLLAHDPSRHAIYLALLVAVPMTGTFPMLPVAPVASGSGETPRPVGSVGSGERPVESPDTISSKPLPWRKLLLQGAGALILATTFFVIQVSGAVPLPAFKPAVADACSGSVTTSWYEGWGPQITRPNNVDGAYTNSLNMYVDAQHGNWTIGCNVHNYFYLIVSEYGTGSWWDNTGVRAAIYQVSNATTGYGTSFNPAGSVAVTFNLNATYLTGGSAAQGTHNYYTALTTCTGTWGAGSTTGGISGAGSSPRAWLIAAGGGTCASITSGDSHSIVYDAQGPNTPTVTYPTSTLFTSASSGAVTWNAVSDNGPAGLAGYYVNYHWAIPNGAGGCTSQGGDSTWLSAGTTNGATVSWVPGWGANTCFQFQVEAMDNALNPSGASLWSAWIIMDNQSPPTTISTSTTCVSPGGTATFTVGRSDPAPSSGWSTITNASTSWWNGTEDPWSGPWRNDPWPGNTNSSATYSVGVPTPAAGTQVTYNRVVWTRDNAGNSSDGVYNQGRNVGANVTVDNTAPSGAGVSGAPAYTKNPTIYFTPSATAGGCAGVTNVAISNDGTHWAYEGNINNILMSWDITNATYGGNSNQGSHTVYVSYNEGGGANWTQISFNVTYDTLPPTVAYTYPTAATTYRNNTSAFNFTWTEDGTGSPVASRLVKLETGSVVANACSWTGSTLVDISGSASAGSVSSGVLSSGKCYRLHITLTDAAANTGSETISNPVMIDTDNPTASVSLSTGAAQWTNAASETVTYSVGDATSGVSVWTLVIYTMTGNNGNGVCTGTAIQVTQASGSASVSNATFTFTPTYPANEGYCYQWHLLANDAATNSNWVNSSQVMFDWVSPAPTFTAPAAQAYVSNFGTGYTFTWTAAIDDASGTVSYNVTPQSADVSATPGVCASNWTNMSAMTNQAGLSYTINAASSPPMANNKCYRVVVAPVDRAGNNSNSGSSLAAMADNVAPTLTYTYPTALSYKNSLGLTFSWNETELGSGINTRTVQFEAIAANNGACPWNPTPILQAVYAYSAGTATLPSTFSGFCYRLYANLVDKAGNSSGTVVSNTVILDTVAPTGSLNINSGAPYTNTTSVTLNPTASDSISGLPALAAVYSNNNTAWSDLQSASSNYGWTLTTGDGTRVVYVRYRDNAGNVSGSYSHTILLDTTAPTVTYTYPGAGTAYRNITSAFPFTWNEVEAGSGVTTRLVKLETGSVVANACSWTGSTLADISGSASAGSVSSGAVSDGHCYRLRVTLTDAAGNPGSETVSNPVMVDTGPPSATYIYPTKVLTYRNIATGISFLWNEADATSGVASRTAQLETGSIVANTCSWSGSTFAFLSPIARSVTTGPVVDGQCYRLHLILTDNAGNSSPDLVSNPIMIDTSAPSSAWVYPTVAGYQTTTDSFNITWTDADTSSGMATRSASLRTQTDTNGVCSGASTGHVVTITGTGPYSVATGSTTPGTCYYLMITLYDNAGNATAYNSPKIIIDTTPPVVSSGCSGTPGVGFLANACTTGNWFISNSVAVTLSAADNESGIVSFGYAIDGVPTSCAAATPYTGPFNVSGDGPHQVYYCAINGAGLAQGGNLFVYIDATAPVVTGTINPISPTDNPASQNGWYLSDPVITLVPTDATSGVANTSYSIDGGTPIVYTVPITVPTGIHTIAYWATDVASNTAATNSFSTKVDTSLPTVLSFVANAYDLAHGGTVPVKVTSYDDTSGTANSTIQLSTDKGATWGPWLPLDGDGTYIGTVTLPSDFATDSLFALQMRVRDNAGNISAPFSGPTPITILDIVTQPLVITLDVAPASATDITCSSSAPYESSTNKITWPTEQSFCILPKINATGIAISTVSDPVTHEILYYAVVAQPGVYTSYEVAGWGPTDSNATYLSPPSTTERVFRPQGVRFTPVHETVGDGITLSITITTRVDFYKPADIDPDTGKPLAGAQIALSSSISFPVTGQVIILNSGTLLLPAATP